MLFFFFFLLSEVSITFCTLRVWNVSVYAPPTVVWAEVCPTASMYVSIWGQAETAAISVCCAPKQQQPTSLSCIFTYSKRIIFLQCGRCKYRNVFNLGFSSFLCDERASLQHLIITCDLFSFFFLVYQSELINICSCQTTRTCNQAVTSPHPHIQSEKHLKVNLQIDVFILENDDCMLTFIRLHPEPKYLLVRLLWSCSSGLMRSFGAYRQYYLQEAL